MGPVTLKLAYRTRYVDCRSRHSQENVEDIQETRPACDTRMSSTTPNRHCPPPHALILSTPEDHEPAAPHRRQGVYPLSHRLYWHRGTSHDNLRHGSLLVVEKGVGRSQHVCHPVQMRQLGRAGEMFIQLAKSRWNATWGFLIERNDTSLTRHCDRPRQMESTRHVNSFRVNLKLPLPCVSRSKR